MKPSRGCGGPDLQYAMSESRHGMELLAVPAGEGNTCKCPGVRNVLPSTERGRKGGSNGEGEEARSVEDVEKAEGTSLHRQSQQRGLSALAGLGGAQMPGYVAPSPAGSPGLLESPFAVESSGVQQTPLDRPHGCRAGQKDRSTDGHDAPRSPGPSLHSDSCLCDSHCPSSSPQTSGPFNTAFLPTQRSSEPKKLSVPILDGLTM